MKIKIENKIISEKSPIYFIGEIGVNHNGSLSLAKKLISEAKKCGCSAVKFQIYKTENLVLKNTKLAKYQKKTGKKNMFDMLKKYELSFDKFKILKKFCDKKKITFLATPFDIESAEFLNKINISAFKISSGDLDNFILLRQIKKFKKPIILSTGMATEEEIRKTLKYLSYNKNKIAILHCISEYPVALKNTQLGFIEKLKKTGYLVGLSDHSKGETACYASVAMGCVIIEKHITFNNKATGPDHKASIQCNFLKSLIMNINDLKKSISHKRRSLTKIEEQNKKVSKKSLYFSRNINSGSIIKFDDIIALRPRLQRGISPSKYNLILKKKIKIKSIKFNPILFSNLI